MSRPSANGEAVVEVLTTVHRRRWTVVKKLELVQESLRPGMNVSYVARKNGISPSLLLRWRKLMSDGGKVAVQTNDQVVGAGEVRALKKRIRDLERMLGKKTMEVEILQEALEIAREKNCSRALRCPGRTVPDEAYCRGADCLALQAGGAGKRAHTRAPASLLQG